MRWCAGLALVGSCSTQAPAPSEVSQYTQALTTTVGWHAHGTKIYPPTSLHAVGGVLDAGETPFRIEAVSWYGFETRDGVAHGLWGNDVTNIVDLIADSGFNTIRIPFSNAMWADSSVVRSSKLSGCPECAGMTARQVLGYIVAEAAARGLKVILDNHRSTAGNSAEANGLWYTDGFPESLWIQHWQQIQQWVNSSHWADTVVAYELRNEPHAPDKGPSAGYLNGSTWGTGDGTTSANPNPFSPACVASSTCHDWRLAAERAGTLLLGQANVNGWPLPLLIVSGIGGYPVDGSTPTGGNIETTWWGGMLKGVNGNSTNWGAPIVFNLGWDASQGLGAPVNGQLVYTAHDYGPALYVQSWFNSSTCYTAGCGGSSLVQHWYDTWGFVTDSIDPAPSGAYPWDNTGAHPDYTGYSAAPLLVGEFGTGDAASDLTSTGSGSQGQWFSALVELIRDSSDGSADATGLEALGASINDLSWGYWALNGNDSYGLTDSGFTSVDTPAKLAALCSIQSSGCPTCGDGTCASTEDCASCAADCGACPFCGDSSCDPNEACGSCPADCGTCPTNDCGNGKCDPGETCNSCGDCAGAKGKPNVRFCCGDGVVDPAEGNGAICQGNY